MGNDRAQWFFGDSFRQNDVGVPVGQRGAQGGQLRAVVGESVALSALVGGDDGGSVLKGQRLNVQPVLAGEVGQVKFGSGALGYADGGALQVIRAADAQFLVDHKALAVEEHGLRVVAPLSIAGSGPGNGADEHINFAGLDGGAALGGGNEANLNLAGVAENGGGHGPAEVNVKADVVAVGVQGAIAGDVVAAGANYLVAGAHGVEAAFALVAHSGRFGSGGGWDGFRGRGGCGGFGSGSGCGRLFLAAGQGRRKSDDYCRAGEVLNVSFHA